jgi:hypothetical protein
MKVVEDGGVRFTFLAVTSCHTVVWMVVERHGDDLLWAKKC